MSVLVIGASSSIAMALIHEHIQHDSSTHVVAITRDAAKLTPIFVYSNNRVQIIASDYTASSVKSICERLGDRSFTHVYICNGVLHTDDIMPEKRMAEFELSTFLKIMESNAAIPMAWLSQLSPLIDSDSIVTVFSARVGSVEDNKLGGWFSYRASKAALNMLVKSAAIELSRRHKGLRVVVFHPGTTDTVLSKPFQKNVPADKLFTPKFVAGQLLSILSTLGVGSSVQFLDWQGKSVQW